MSETAWAYGVFLFLTLFLFIGSIFEGRNQ